MLDNTKRQDIKVILQQVWGYEDFRYPQAEIINCLLNKQDTLVIMPTGGGKSLCFQLPALLQPGLTIVVSPLVALMENQVQQLQQKKIAAGLIHSQQAKSDRKLIISNLTQLKLLYVAPETLLTPPIWEKLLQPDLMINNLIIDEAHCIVQWGTTFRSSYTRLGVIRDALHKHKQNKITIAAFTATADTLTQQTIIKTLRLKKQFKKFVINPYRSNLQLKVKTVWTAKGRKKATLKFIQQQHNKSGLIYVRSRKASELLAKWLREQKLNTVAYHGGIINSKRRAIEQDWLTGKLPFVICTCAFGMGIDKSDCRWILHYHTPELLPEYLQEIGRSGRDNKPAIALALISEPTGWLDNEDKQRSQFFTNQLAKQSKQAKKVFEILPSQGNILDIIKEIPDSELALGILQNLDLIQWQDIFNYQKKSSNKNINSVSTSQQTKQMQQFLQTKQCRWQYILSAFSFIKEAKDFKCSKCDRCSLEKPSRIISNK
ncbi:ATP-dependent DNA helicase RecQ [Hyella patelloides LEGE 07179]|uniref:ATP-dependent DNA helicase RecQ n=1 Tax=Hyella patelloides LEGE 07179 TaxID=945734 RepID=A0A563VX21_9CYAN|nr:RecQ family ATP-dependent DNA helicase [Hyella patelloides]VEP16008.1 ATP-dependent DNA helicase RecQ [Hyella patelloides LEGE 07179]